MSSHSNNLNESKLFRYFPLLAYLGTYVLTCFVGAVLLLADVEPFASLYGYFTGTVAPNLTQAQSRVVILLLIGAPLLLTVGYGLGALIRIPARSLRFSARGCDNSNSLELSFVVFALLAIWAGLQLAQLIDFADLKAWLDYPAWVAMRWRLFEGMGFFSFVNVYLLLPLAAAWCLLESLFIGKSRVLGLVAVMIALVVALLLFQKKAAVVTILIVTFSAGLYFTQTKGITFGRRVLSIGMFAATVIYFSLVVVPVYSETSRTIQQSELAERKTDGAGGEQKKEHVPEIIAESRNSAIFAYALLAPLTRTSAPSLYYPVVFPAKHEYYGLDLGQDILGFGEMPDDNYVVYRYMNPDIPGATVAPFQFVLFSQVGWIGALIGSLIMGIILRVLWSPTLKAKVSPIWSSLFGGMVILLAIYIAIDSLRNSVVVSYGVGWGFAFLIVVRLLSSFSIVRLPRVMKASK